ncbi:MAG: GspH/FimT family pseudopilin [Methylibium sp.]
MQPLWSRCRGSLCGFTLVELMVTITLLAILLALAVPSFTLWINNTRVRSTAQVLQDGLRQAQAEAVRRNRTVSFFLTNVVNPTADSAADANGGNWGIRVLPLTGTTREFVRGGALAGVNNGVTITSANTAVCFNAAGQQVANATEGCTIDATDPEAVYDVAHPGSDRPLRVIASLGGRVRMCDPAKTLSAANPDGCPP